MADFNVFFPILLKQEGYYADDSGGETWEGISRKNYPTWTGWAIIDAHTPTGGFTSTTQANAILKPLPDLAAKIPVFYKVIQWNPILGDQIENQSIANYIADWGVNAGLSIPVKHAQQILSLPDDGIMGPNTLNAINSADGQTFFNALKAARIQFYHDVVTAHPNFSVYLNTWLARANYFTYQP